MWGFRRKVIVTTERIELRLPRMSDHAAWARLRHENESFLRPWEPVRSGPGLSRRVFRSRVYWSRKSLDEGTGLNLLAFRTADGVLLGSIACRNIRRGSAQCGTLSYWIGESFTRQGLMTEAVEGIVDHAFYRMDLSRLEAACLPENVASRRLLEKAGFREEGLAESYLQIGGRWRDHVLYARLRDDRKGVGGAGTGPGHRRSP
ncbi:MAG: GNAT family protein [Paracoccaceae bacterium]|nr:GNAT family protein [Paracoccaceae bacterium]MDE2914297.1 GNAT family protein [Paracoccaceae bacterium]